MNLSEIILVKEIPLKGQGYRGASWGTSDWRLKWVREVVMEQGHMMMERLVTFPWQR